MRAIPQGNVQSTCHGSVLSWTAPFRLEYNDGVYQRKGKVPIRVGDFNLNGRMDLLFLSHKKRLKVVSWHALEQKFLVFDATPII